MSEFTVTCEDCGLSVDTDTYEQALWLAAHTSHEVTIDSDSLLDCEPSATEVARAFDYVILPTGGVDEETRHEHARVKQAWLGGTIDKRDAYRYVAFGYVTDEVAALLGEVPDEPTE